MTRRSGANDWFQGRCSNCTERKLVHKLKSVQICTACAGAVTEESMIQIIRTWNFPDLFEGKFHFPNIADAVHKKAPGFFGGALEMFRHIKNWVKEPISKRLSFKAAQRKDFFSAKRG
jgi:hypothetical protein